MLVPDSASIWRLCGREREKPEYHQPVRQWPHYITISCTDARYQAWEHRTVPMSPLFQSKQCHFVYMYTLINVSPGMCSSIYSRQEEEELTSTFHNDKGKLALTWESSFSL